MCNNPWRRLREDAKSNTEAQDTTECGAINTGRSSEVFISDIPIHRYFVGKIKVRDKLQIEQSVILLGHWLLWVAPAVADCIYLMVENDIPRPLEKIIKLLACFNVHATGLLNIGRQFKIAWAVSFEGRVRQALFGEIAVKPIRMGCDCSRQFGNPALRRSHRALIQMELLQTDLASLKGSSQFNPGKRTQHGVDKC